MSSGPGVDGDDHPLMGEVPTGRDAQGRRGPKRSLVVTVHLQQADEHDRDQIRMTYAPSVNFVAAMTRVIDA